MKSRIVLVLLGLSVLLAAGGCASQAPTPSVEPKPAFERLLSLVPDTAESRHEVWLNDYMKMREVYGLPLPTPRSYGSSLPGYIDSLQQQARPAPAPWISGYDDYAHVTNPMFLQYLGFNAYGVEQSALAGRSPSFYEVLLGTFDPESTDKAIQACSNCPEPFRVEYRGMRFYSWDEDFKISIQRRNTPPAFDYVGRGGRVLVSDDHVIRTVWTDGMISTIETQAGLRSSLADVEEFELLVQSLRQIDAYSAFLTDQVMCITRALSSLPGYGITKEALERFLEEHTPRMLRPYLAFAVGIGKDDMGRYMTLVLVHEDAESAMENVAMLQSRIDETESWTLRQTWADAIDKVEITSEGRVLMAKLRGDRVSLNWVSMVVENDPLLMMEDVPVCLPPPGPPTPTAAPTLTR